MRRNSHEEAKLIYRISDEHTSFQRLSLSSWPIVLTTLMPWWPVFFVAGSSCSIMVPAVFTSPFQMQLQNQKREGGEEEENKKTRLSSVGSIIRFSSDHNSCRSSHYIYARVNLLCTFISLLPLETSLWPFSFETKGIISATAVRCLCHWSSQWVSGCAGIHRYSPGISLPPFWFPMHDRS